MEEKEIKRRHGREEERQKWGRRRERKQRWRERDGGSCRFLAFVRYLILVTPSLTKHMPCGRTMYSGRDHRLP